MLRLLRFCNDINIKDNKKKLFPQLKYSTMLK